VKQILIILMVFLMSVGVLSVLLDVRTLLGTILILKLVLGLRVRVAVINAFLGGIVGVLLLIQRHFLVLGIARLVAPN
jgi:hypothetical protein